MNRFRWMVVGLAAIGGAFWLGSRQSVMSNPATETVARPMVLTQIQALGDLHSARYTFENVFEQTSYRRPEGVLAAVPGADSVARAATSNSALVSADGTVEAGVDLKKAKLSDQRIVLPHATVYEPQVHMKVHQVRRGIFWRDDNLALAGLENAKERMASAALERGILKEAEENALHQVQRLISLQTSAPVAVIFE